jgi:hypothetical protein
MPGEWMMNGSHNLATVKPHHPAEVKLRIEKVNQVGPKSFPVEHRISETATKRTERNAPIPFSDDEWSEIKVRSRQVIT